MPIQPLRTVRLKKRDARRVERGHPWVFSNEIIDPPKDAEPGEILDVLDFSGRFIGRGYYNPRTLISIRLLTNTRDEINRDFLRGRISSARALRQKLGFGDSYRAVFSEGDLLPGLIVDKFGDVLVVQSLTAGIDRLLNEIIATLDDVYTPDAIVLRNDSPSRALEGLPIERRVVKGEPAERLIIEESGIKYAVDVLKGQKTGFFFDQRENRLALRGLVKDRRVLDCFCYTGAWSLSAAKFGASEVTGIDSSDQAISLAVQNAAMNNLKVFFKNADVFDELKEMEKRQERFGCIILDPPAFAKSRAKIREAIKGYKEINRRALRLMEPGGVLVSCSCSYHVNQDLFREMLIDAAHAAGRGVRLLELRSQSRDHPMPLAAREAQYLKCAVLIID